MSDTHPAVAALITDSEEVRAAAARIAASRLMALDTEFVRESTYHARLCLVQVCVNGEALCIDPLSGADLEPLWDAVLARQSLNLMHSARQDLELIHQCTGRLPAALFDTQIAAGLAGMQPQIGYAGLVQALLDVHLPKTHTRTDWSRRPLSAEQLSYAADDVRHLPALYELLRERLVAQGRLAWAEQDSAALLDPAIYLNPPELAWQRLKGLRRLDGDGQQAAAALAAWREDTAARLDRPRQWIMSDALLLAVAAGRPDDADALTRVPQMPPALVRRRGDEILRTLRERGGQAPLAGADSGPLDDSEKARLERLLRVTRECAADLGVDPQLLAPRAELMRIARGGGEVSARVFGGWRAEVLGEALQRAL